MAEEKDIVTSRISELSARDQKMSDIFKDVSLTKNILYLLIHRTNLINRQNKHTT